jgi:nucleoside-diphosphate-sugar epimerase
VTVLVTGANGFVGSAVVKRLLARGEQGVRCLVRPGSDPSRLEGLDVEVMRGTLSRREDCVRAVEEAAIVFHLAAGTSGAAADQMLNSVVATRNLLDAMVAAPQSPKLVHCSSFGVYGVADLPRGALVDETTPLEPHPELRDVYSHAKLQQERVVWQYQRERGLSVVVLRPGVIYGPGGAAMSNRVGLRIFGVFLHLGRQNVLPLTYVDNCAEAFVVAGRHEGAVGNAYNVVDDDLITASEFLRRYRDQVDRVPKITLPWFATRVMTALLERYVDWSKGQIPPVFTRYKVDSAWKGNRFSNDRLKALGWHPLVTTEDGLRRHFDSVVRR